MKPRETTSTEREAGEATPSRRRALARLGFAAAVAYSTPTIIKIDRSARAVILPTPCEPPPDFPPGFPPPPCP